MPTTGRSSPEAPPGIRGRLAQDLAAPTRWPALDGVRGVALIAVVSYHLLRFIIDTGNHRLSWPWWPLMGTSRLGLDAFFVLSGVLVVVSWRAVRRRAESTASALAEFWRRRSRRIFPAYWLSLAVFAPLIVPDWFRSLEGWGKLLLFVTVQQNLIDHLPNQINTPYWTLTTEFHFYMLVPLVALLSLRRGWRWAALGGTLALSVVWWSGLRGNMAASFIFGRLDQFVAGAIIGDLVVGHMAGRHSRLVAVLQRRQAAWVLGAALLAVGTWHGSRLWAAPGTPLNWFLHPVAGLILAGLFVHLLSNERSAGKTLLSHSSLRFFGLISYSVYLWHYPMQAHGLRWLGVDSNDLTPLLGVIAAGVVVMAACLAVGVISYLIAERPVMRRTGPPARAPDRERDQATVPARGGIA